MSDLSHWNSKEFLTFQQVVCLAVGVDPYSESEIAPEIAARQKLLREHMNDSHMRACNWSFELIQRLRADSHCQKYCELLTRYGSEVGFTGELDAVELPAHLRPRKMHAGGKGLLASVELHEEILRTVSGGRMTDYSTHRLFAMGDLKKGMTFDRDTLQLWFNYLGWPIQYCFSRFFVVDAHYVISATTGEIALAENEAPISPRERNTLHPRERNTLLNLILGMAIDAYAYDPKAQKSPTPKEIADALSEREGLKISDDTVRKYLNEASGREKRVYRRTPNPN